MNRNRIDPGNSDRFPALQIINMCTPRLTVHRPELEQQHYLDNITHIGLAASSPVWNFFRVSEKDVKLAVWKRCDVEIPRGGNQQRQFNTTNLIRHLRTRHTTEYGEYEKQARAKQIPRTPVTQLTVRETFRRLEPLQRGQYKVVHKARL